MCSGFQFGRSALLRLSILVVLLHGLVATAAVNPLSFRPNDAAYSRALDRLIFISADPNQLHIYDAATQSDQTVALSDTPLNVSLSPDGKHAAVTHSTSIAYVGLETATIEQTFSNIPVGSRKVTVGVGYLYLMQSSSDVMRSIDLSTGQVTASLYNIGDSGGTFDSRVNAVYSLENASSLPSLLRYPATGVLDYSTSRMRDYQGAFNICGPLYLSEDGSAIYTGCGTAFRATTDATQDMRYLGTLPGIDNVQSLSQSAALNQVAVIRTVQSYMQGSAANNDTIVNLFDSASFNAAGSLATTPFIVNSISYPAHGRWIFYNSSATALLIVTQADGRAALTRDFAVESVDLTTPNSCNALFGGTSASIAGSGGYGNTPVLSGEGCLFTAVSNAPWIVLSSGYFGSGDTSLTYLVRPNPGSSPRSGTITLGGQVFTVNQDGRTPTSGVAPLSFKPVAADYDKLLDRMVMVSAAPNELHIYDPVTQDDQIVPLGSVPLSVSVRPDGLFAAVGHRGGISIVDLQSPRVTQTFPVDMNMAAIVLASNGYAYGFPPASNFGGAVNSVQLSNGALTSLDCSSCNYPRLHPSGNVIYTGGYSMSRLDISNGPATYSYLSWAGGNIWLSESGDRLLTWNGTSYLTSALTSMYPAANGSLSASNNVAWVVNSQLLHQTAVLSDVTTLNQNTQVQLYSDEGLVLIEQSSLPSFSISGLDYRSHGRYLFWNASASKLFAIMQADGSSGLLSDYAVFAVGSPDSTPACSYSVSPSALSVPSSGNLSWYFDVSSNCTWSSTLNAPSNWLYLPLNYTTGSGRATVLVTAVNTGQARSASIRIGDKVVTVNQAPASCVYTLDATSRSFTQAGGPGDVNLTTNANCPWSIQSSSSWVSLTTAQSGTGPATLRYTVASNATATASRSASINIAGQTYTIQQTTIPVSAASSFVPVTPCRIADTRNPRGPFGGPFLDAKSTRVFSIVNSNCNIPNTATAYSLNITVVPRGALNYLTAWPSGQAQPFVSTLNSGDGRVKANAAIIAAGPTGAVSFYTTDPTDLVVDITGYFVNANTGLGLAFYPLTPCRISDTREANAPLSGPVISAGETRQLPILQSVCNLSTSANAYSLNFTAIPEDRVLQYLTTWPSGQERPTVSTLNSWTGSVAANAAILQAGSAGDISVYATDRSHLAIDTNGYFALPGTGGLYFYGVAPCRVFDSRVTGDGQPFRDAIAIQIAGSCNIPSTASAVVLNTTVVPSPTLSYLTLWPTAGDRPVVSTLNAYDGAISSNMAITPLSGGSLNVFATDNTQVILDVTGYFAP